MTDEPHDIASSEVIHLGVARFPSFDGNHAAVELHTLAGSFLYDAVELRKMNDMRASHGQYFLLIHAIELMLKCYLHERGVSLETLATRAYGHDLEKLFNAAVDKGLVASNGHTVPILVRLNKYTKKARIRYDMSFLLPLISDVEAVARSLFEDTEPRLPGAG